MVDCGRRGEVDCGTDCAKDVNVNVDLYVNVDGQRSAEMVDDLHADLIRDRSEDAICNTRMGASASTDWSWRTNWQMQVQVH